LPAIRACLSLEITYEPKVSLAVIRCVRNRYVIDSSGFPSSKCTLDSRPEDFRGEVLTEMDEILIDGRPVDPQELTSHGIDGLDVVLAIDYGDSDREVHRQCFPALSGATGSACF